MPRVETRLSDTDKAAWKGFCLSQGRTESDMLRMMIQRVTAQQDVDQSQQYQSSRSKQINIRLTENNLSILDQRAKEEGYQNRTKWTTAVVLAALNHEPVLTENEINALRESNRELAALGRNLNQIARALNIEFRDSDKITLDAITRLEKSVDNQKKHVSGLLDRNMNRWSSYG